MGQSLPVLSAHRKREVLLIASQDRAKRMKKPTAENPLIISASELRDFLRCRVKWSWRYHHRLQPRIPKNNNLSFGGLVHNILEAWYALPDSKRNIKGMRRVAKRILAGTHPDELTLEDLELAKAMCVGYAAWAKPRDADLVMRNIQSEHWFELPLTIDKSIIVRGKIDVVFDQRALKRTLGALEHKTKAQIKVDMVDLNLQLSVYLWAMRKLFPKKKRYVAHYNVLRKQMPGPRVKADLFARESVERMDDEIDAWEQDTRRAALDMLDAAIYPNPTDQCGWDCDYQVPCMMRGRPSDLDHVLRRDFITRDGAEIEGIK